MKHTNKKRKNFWVVLFLLVFTGCQGEKQTENFHILSEKETTVTDETKEKKDSMKETLKVPEEIETTWKSPNEKSTVRISAKVIVPDERTIKEKEICPRRYTQEEANAIISGLFPDGKLYETWYIYDSDGTTSKNKTERSVLFEKNNEEARAFFKEGEEKKGHLTWMILGQNKAYNENVYDFSLSDYERMRKGILDDFYPVYGVSVELSRIEENQYKADNESSSSDEVFYTETGMTKEEVMEKGYSFPDLEEKKAQKMAEDMMEKCHLKSYRLFSVSYCMEQMEENEKHLSYEFYFVKQEDGISVFDGSEILGAEEKESTASFFWAQEGVRVVVDEKGVVSLNGGSDGEIRKTGDPCQLLPFSEIKKIMEAALLQEEDDKIKTEISHIELGYLRKGDHMEEEEISGILKPAWLFFGKRIRYTDREVIGEYGNRNLKLAIDASTGEVLGEN